MSVRLFCGLVYIYEWCYCFKFPGGLFAQSITLTASRRLPFSWLVLFSVQCAGKCRTVGNRNKVLYKTWVAAASTSWFLSKVTYILNWKCIIVSEMGLCSDIHTFPGGNKKIHLAPYVHYKNLINGSLLLLSQINYSCPKYDQINCSTPLVNACPHPLPPLDNKWQTPKASQGLWYMRIWLLHLFL